MASTRDREVEKPAAEPIDFRILLLGAWPDGGEEEPQLAADPLPEPDPADDPQWITWADARAEQAWEDIEIALTLGAVAAPRTR